MELLTGKAKIDFGKWYYKNIHFVGLCDVEEHLNQTINALIIEWLDSVNIFVNSSGLILSKNFISDVSISQNMEFYYDGFKTRSEATQQAILKANEIYNNLNTKQNEK